MKRREEVERVGGGERLRIEILLALKYLGHVFTKVL